MVLSLGHWSLKKTKKQICTSDVQFFNTRSENVDVIGLNVKTLLSGI